MSARTAIRPDVKEATDRLEFVVYQPEGRELLGDQPSLEVALEDQRPIFHEAGAFIDEHLFVTSNIINNQIHIHRLSRPWKAELVPSADVVMANGGVATPAGDAILFCAQGNREHSGGLVLMSKDLETKNILSSYHGRWFNSVNDVVYARDGSIWFTDPIYGFEQGFRHKPQLPSQLYRFDPTSNDLRAMADGFSRPNGLCFSPDERTLYVTDTDWIHGDGTTDNQRVSHIYAFSVETFNRGQFLTHRRVFAMADKGAPDGIKCDSQGNVYSGCGDGVNVWDAAGRLIMKIKVPGGVANFCFGRAGELLMLNETRFVVANLSPEVVSATTQS